jgi:hypothetical protein
MGSEILAAVVLLACVAALVRMALGERRRQRLDATLQHHGRRLSQRARSLWRQRRLSGQARREADELIRRARRPGAGTAREGNVVRPQAFGNRRRDRDAVGDEDIGGPGRDDAGRPGDGPPRAPGGEPPDGRGRRDH